MKSHYIKYQDSIRSRLEGGGGRGARGWISAGKGQNWGDTITHFGIQYGGCIITYMASIP